LSGREIERSFADIQREKRRRARVLTLALDAAFDGGLGLAPRAPLVPALAHHGRGLVDLLHHVDQVLVRVPLRDVHALRTTGSGLGEEREDDDRRETGSVDERDDHDDPSAGVILVRQERKRSVVQIVMNRVLSMMAAEAPW
jgi:hypothetical protein